MGRWLIAPRGVTEPAPAPEFFVTGIGAIETFEGGLRFHLVQETLPLESKDGETERVVVVKIVGSSLKLGKVIMQLASCLPGVSDEPAPAPSPIKPRLVK